MKKRSSLVYVFALAWCSIGLCPAISASDDPPKDDPKKEAIRMDHQRIRGTWVVSELVVDGNRADEKDARRLTVENGDDGTWKLLSEGKEVCRGTSTIDPLLRPKSMDFKVTDGEGAGKSYAAIYELGEEKRKMCFGPTDQKRPSAFTSVSGSKWILVHFERVKKPE